jgi:hypothetical protein
MEDSKSVPVGSRVGQNEMPVPTGSRTQPSEPTGGKNRITNMALKRPVYAGVGREMGEVARVCWTENRGVVCLGTKVQRSLAVLISSFSNRRTY